ncbi:MAG: hypothetical protein A2622_03065 [Bdellovibrionales bacterium RIFCSPHIGHO2_01_FULL_40_29]|nr:MAG: hypothetical protein A2622_03065 [Bdellovibrionales bacterium RIFCSPHIGHO2_01_FULL_40_29]OFZ34054.1 MAG: hypothetical protein A3D17_03485 [Bdellovibrionales bacterium RIFCSPHIGHO2_02_FULL_40_15]
MAYSPLLKKLPPNFDILIPFHQFDHELVRELSLNSVAPILATDRLFITSHQKIKPIWAQDWWPNCVAISYTSKSEILKTLKSKSVLGHYYASEDSKIAKGLLKELKNFDKKRIDYRSQFQFKYFCWTAIGETIFICDQPISRFPIGWHEFNEDKSFPPNRAYLKLWELFTIYKLKPQPDAVAIELGASPGGWSWVLSQHFKKVYTVDRAELDPKIKKIQNIHHSIGDAFKVSDQDFNDCTWLFSDIICTPVKSYDLIMHWMNYSNIKNIVCTIKFKGDCDFEILAQLLKIKNSQIIHLYQNKNEVTWILQR